MKRLVVRKSGPLRGPVRVPADREIGAESVVLAALAQGASTIRGTSAGDHDSLIASLREMGVPIAQTADALLVSGVGVDGLKMPKGALSAGTSRTTLELLAALLSGQHFGTRINAQGTASERSLRTLVEPLRERGAMIAAAGGDEGELRAPISVAPLTANERLREIEIEIPLGDATTKRALLISGLYARGITVVNEGVISRDHTERALMSLGLAVETIGTMTLLDTSGQMPSWNGFDWSIPGDFTIAAFLIAAASLVSGSDVLLESVCVNPTRAAFLTLLRHGGARVELVPKGDMAGNEPIANVRVRAGAVSRVQLGGELSRRMQDEVWPALAVATFARSRSSLRDLSFLRLNKPDAFGRAAALLRAFGGECTDFEDGCDIDPRTSLRAVRVAAGEPAQVALLGVLLGLVSEGETIIEDASGIDALYPGVIDRLRSLGASIDEEESSQ